MFDVIKIWEEKGESKLAYELNYKLGKHKNISKDVNSFFKGEGLCLKISNNKRWGEMSKFTWFMKTKGFELQREAPEFFSYRFSDYLT